MYKAKKCCLSIYDTKCVIFLSLVVFLSGWLIVVINCKITKFSQSYHLFSLTLNHWTIRSVPVTQHNIKTY